MKKNRYLLCLLICGAMLYYAVPQLSVTAAGPKGIFSLAWLSLALMVIAGNLTGILYSPKKAGQKQQPNRNKRKSRMFH